MVAIFGFKVRSANMLELNDISYTARHSGPYSLFIPSRDDNGWYAGFWLRAFAALWDIFVLGILQVLLIKVVSWVISDGSLDVLLSQLLMLSERDLESLNHHLFLWLLFAPIPCILVVGYFSLFESGRLGATPGKLLLGICVIDYEENPPGFKQSAFRNTMKLLWLPVYLTGLALTASIGGGSNSLLAQGMVTFSTLSALILFLFTFVMVAYTADKQSFYDEWANCFVVRKDRVGWLQRLILAALILLIYMWLLAEYFPRPARETGSVGMGTEGSIPAVGIVPGIPNLGIGGEVPPLRAIGGESGGETPDQGSSEGVQGIGVGLNVGSPPEGT
jgi:uncharacterized RDD family membrane protein YckC